MRAPRLAVLAALLLASRALAETEESRWNLLNLLPDKPVTSAPSESPEDLLSAAEEAARKGRTEYATALYHLAIDNCRPGAPCAKDLDKARLGLGLAMAKLARPEDGEDLAAQEAVRWLETVKDPPLRARAEPELERMRDLLARKRPQTSTPRLRADGSAPRPADGAPLPSARAGLSRAAAIGGGAFDGDDPDQSSLSVSASVRNGQPTELSLAKGNWQASVGQLGIASRSPLWAESPFVNGRYRRLSGIDSPVDTHFEAQAGVIDMRARLFGNDASHSPDAAKALAKRLGLPDRYLSQFDSAFATDDPWQKNLGVLAGAMAQAGRAVRLPFQSPVAVDLAVSGTALVKTAGLAPNAGANASGGVRVTLPSGHQLVLIGGRSEDFSPIGRTVLPDLVAGRKAPKLGFNRETSYQASGAVKGPVPGLPSVDFEVGASQRWSAEVVEQKVQGEVSAPIKDKRAKVRVSYKNEQGSPEIEFSRRGLAVEGSLTLYPGVEAWVRHERDNPSLGGVDISYMSTLAGVNIVLGARGKATWETVFGGKDAVAGVPPEQAAALAATMARLGAAGLSLADRLAKIADPFEALAAAAKAIVKLPESEVAAVVEAVASSPLPDDVKNVITTFLVRETDNFKNFSAPNAATIQRAIERRIGSLPDWRKEYDSRRVLAEEAVAFLSDRTFWERATAAAIRHQFIAGISGVSLSLGPLGTLKIKPGMAILAASALRYPGSPQAPVTARAAEKLERDMIAELAKIVGASGKDSAAIVEAMVVRGRDAFARYIETEIIPRLAPLNADRVGLANKALAALPADIAARLRAELGADLGLGELDPARLEAALRELPEIAAREMRAKIAPEAVTALNQAAALIAQTLRREINRTLLQLMLASEELDRLTIDRGMKLGDLGARMIAESYAQLDDRLRADLRRRRNAWLERLNTDIERDEDDVADDAAAGIARSAKESRPGRSGPRVELDAFSRTQLLGAYGEEELRAAIARFSAGMPLGTSVDLVIRYGAHEVFPSVRRSKDGKTILLIGPPGRSKDFALDNALRQALPQASLPSPSTMKRRGENVLTFRP